MANGKRQDFQRSNSWAPNITDEVLDEIICRGNAEKLNKIAEDLGKYYAEGKEKLSTSQIRNVLHRLQRISKYDKNQLHLLRPLLAYQAGRHKGKVRDFQEVFDRAVKKTDNEKKFENLRNFLEAIVAYHRFHGGE